jgi:maltooligosyltrehalose trehalohydrolase
MNFTPSAFGREYNYSFKVCKQTLVFSRRLGNNFTLVALNFGPQDQRVPFVFPLGGNYREELHGLDDPDINLQDVTPGVDQWITVPSHYGRVWTHVEV